MLRDILTYLIIFIYFWAKGGNKVSPFALSFAVFQLLPVCFLHLCFYGPLHVPFSRQGLLFSRWSPFQRYSGNVSISRQRIWSEYSERLFLISTLISDIPVLSATFLLLILSWHFINIIHYKHLPSNPQNLLSISSFVKDIYMY